jgi:hypothetical protein
LTKIAGVDDEVRFVGHGVDLVDCDLERSRNVWIGRLVEADVAVADLHKGEVRAFADIFAGVFGEYARCGNATAHRPDQACARPCHAL